MIGICILLGLACATAERPPRVDPAIPISAPVVAAMPVVKPPVARPQVRPVDAFPLACERVPPVELRQLFVEAARKHPGVSACELAKQAWCESNFKVDAVSPANAKGIAQFLDATARELGVSNAFDPHQAVPAMARYVNWSRGAWDRHGRSHDEIVALGGGTYNFGRGAMYRNQAAHGWYHPDEAMPHLPPETQGYIPCILTGERK